MSLVVAPPELSHRSGKAMHLYSALPIWPALNRSEPMETLSKTDLTGVSLILPLVVWWSSTIVQPDTQRKEQPQCCLEIKLQTNLSFDHFGPSCQSARNTTTFTKAWPSETSVVLLFWPSRTSHVRQEALIFFTYIDSFHCHLGFEKARKTVFMCLEKESRVKSKSC